MKRKVTFDELKEVKADIPNYCLVAVLDVVNAAFEAVSEAAIVSKEGFLKVVASTWSVMYFIGKAWLAAREEEKSDLSWYSYYLFHELLNK